MTDELSFSGQLEIVCWYLNHHESENVSTEQIVDDTGLDREDVQSATSTLRRLQTIAPGISEGDGSTDIRIDKKSSAASDLFSHDTLYVANYLLTLGRVRQNANREITLENHSALEGYGDAIETMESYGWLIRDDGTVRLTTDGVVTIGSEQAKATYEFNPRNPDSW